MLRLVLITLLLSLIGCKSADIKSFQSGENIVADTEGEKRLWYQANKFDVALAKSKQTSGFIEIQNYLQGLMDQLYPEFKGSIRVKVHKAPVLNAFALPNGSVYINLGLLASLENEAQIASVLAHEGAHFLEKHSAKQRVYRHNSQGWAVATSMFVPFVGQLVAMNAMSGYSVEHESEADEIGYKRLKKAGFSTFEAPRAFEILAREAKANEDDGPYFFASHPKLQVRIDNFIALNNNADQNDGIVGFERYQEVVGPIRELVLEQKLSAGKVAAVLATLEDPASTKLYQERHNYLLALTLLKQGDELRKDEAIQLLQTTIEQQPDFALAHRELGYFYYKAEQADLASQHLHKFINLANAEHDTAFAEYYLQKLQ